MSILIVMFLVINLFEMSDNKSPLIYNVSCQPFVTSSCRAGSARLPPSSGSDLLQVSSVNNVK